jgi:SAM-dependent methyltransferase
MIFASYVPWWAKIGAKLALSRLPIPYSFWSRVALFRHGDMSDPRRAINAFRAHFHRAQAVRPLDPGFAVMELGPGDSVLSAGVARAFGASKTYLVDAGDFARRDPELFYALVRSLPAAGLPALDLPKGLAFEAVLSTINAQYLTGGVASLAAVATGSVDLVWSSVVLEHIHKGDFDRFASELARILKPSGVMSHAVDLRDHLGGSLNNLRFSEELWESEGWRKSGFYTNRLSQAEIITAFTRAGLRVVSIANDLWPAPPLSRAKMNEQFKNRTDDELCIAGFDIVLTHATE